MRILHGSEIYLEQSGHARALRLERLLPRRSAGIIAFGSGVTVILGLILTLFFLTEKQIVYACLGLTLVALGIFLGVGVFWLFSGFLRLERPLSEGGLKQALQHEALGSSLTFAAASLLQSAAEGDSLYPSRFWLYVTKQERFVSIWKRLGINTGELREKASSAYPPAAVFSLLEILQTAWTKVLAAGRSTVDDVDILMALFTTDEILHQILFGFEVEEADFLAVALWELQREHDRTRRAKFWSRERLLDISGVGKDWSAGYTVNLDRLAVDITAGVEFKRPPEHLYGHRRQISQMERLLVRSSGGSNVVLVGEPGVGRHTFLRAFAARVRSGETLSPLRYRRVMQIDSSAVLGGTGNQSDILQKIVILLNEAVAAGNVILVINNIDAFLDPQPEVGRLNATEALLPYFQSSLRVVGITTKRGYQETIEKHPQLQEILSKLEIAEPTPAETLEILEDETPRVERRTGVWFTYLALEEIVSLSQRLIQNIPNPEKALELLQETAVYTATNVPSGVVGPEQVQRVVTLRTKIPVERVQGQEKEILLNLETVLHERVVGQEDAIRQIADALRRARAGISSGKRPIGSFLFLGPTGVGKTETAKALAAAYFGSENRMIRLDMSEYQGNEGVSRLIGEVGSGSGLLTEAVLAEPFSLILLDEVEKANPKVLDLFLQVLDDGRLTDAMGRTVSFTNTMIIATSNAGAELIREIMQGGRNPAEARESILDSLQRQGIFRPEFINRFDGVIIYQPLNEAVLTKIAGLLLRELNVRLKEREVSVKITPELTDAVARGGYSVEFGARPLRRYIQEHIENYVARGLISGDIKRGDLIEIPPNMV